MANGRGATIHLPIGSSVDDLLNLANAEEVADLIAMRDLARERLLPRLPAGPVCTGSTFDGSADLAADADLIAGGMLVDFKASRGSHPRSNGTRSARLARTDMDQLNGANGSPRCCASRLANRANRANRATWPAGQPVTRPVPGARGMPSSPYICLIIRRTPPG